MPVPSVNEHKLNDDDNDDENKDNLKGLSLGCLSKSSSSYCNVTVPSGPRSSPTSDAIHTVLLFAVSLSYYSFDSDIPSS
jgi:hypothetical protein